MSYWCLHSYMLANLITRDVLAFYKDNYTLRTHDDVVVASLHCYCVVGPSIIDASKNDCDALVRN